MKQEDEKLNQSNKNSRAVSTALILVVLCGVSFSLGSIFCSQKYRYGILDFGNVIPSSKAVAIVPLQIKAVAFPECDSSFQDYTPCTDPKRWKRYKRHRFSFLERHCPPVFERKECLVPPPDGYKSPIRWPKSRDECWYRNVPYDWINKQKSNQHWLKKEGEKFLFPGGGTMFPNGVSIYVDLMQDLIPAMKDGTIRTAIDTGCGVASWGGDLLDRGILTVSLAPRDNHEAQVQFALERGIPAILGIISTQRLPFPSNSFDMAHCSRCLIPWTEYGGVYLLEIHRILRTGGFWVLSGPPINFKRRSKGWNSTVDEQRSNYEKLQGLLTSMCFKLYNQKGDIAVWQKLSNNSCYVKLQAPNNYPPKCDDGTEPDSAWYTPMRPCVVVPDQKHKQIELSSLAKWPERLHAYPERVGDLRGGSRSAFKHDDSKWEKRVKHYKTLLPALGTNKIRNVMDMNTVYGGFAAAMIDYPLWVMNVVSSYSLNTLPVVYDRGLIGAYHDWCEAFSTYPRTYDLLHLNGLFTAESHRCEMKFVLLEMDRILRPNGYAIIRESTYFVDAITTLAKGMRWGCRKEDNERANVNEKILICQKKLWYSSTKNSRKPKIDQKTRKLFQRRARDYNSDDEDEDEPLEQAADVIEIDGKRKNNAKFEVGSDDGEEENEGLDEEEEVSEDEGGGMQPGVVRFSEGIKAFKLAFKKIVKKSGGDEDILGPVLSAHKKLIGEKLAEEEAEKKVKGEAKKEKHLVFNFFDFHFLFSTFFASQI